MSGRWKAYPKYKPSGVEWLGDVPEGWEILRVKDMAAIINGYPFDSALFSMANGIPLIRIRDLLSNTTEVRYDGPEVAEAVVEKDDLLIGMDGDFNVARWRGVRALLNQRMCCLRPGGSTRTKYLEHILPSPLKIINDLTYSTTVKHLSSGDVAKIRIPMPLPEELNSICAFLDRETARIDALVEKKERLIDLLREKRAALIAHAVTKGLDPTAPMKDSGVEWLGKVPAHWTINKLFRLVQCLDGKRVPLNAVERGIMQGDYPYWGANSIVDRVDRWIFDEELVLLGEDGAPFFEAGKTVAHHVSGKVWVNNHAHVLRPRMGMAPSFLAHALNVLDYTPFIEGTTRDKLTQAKMNSIPIQVPPEEEQERIVVYLDSETARIDALVEKIRRAIDLLREYRTALVSAAVTGKIDVREATA